MGFKVQDLSATASGSALAIRDWWDSKRIESEILTHKAVLKKAGFYPWHAAVAAIAVTMGELRGVSQITSTIAEMASAFNSTKGCNLKINRLVTILAEMVSSTLSWEEHHGRLPHDKH